MRQIALVALVLVLSLTTVFVQTYAASCWSTPASVTAMGDASPGSLTIDPSGDWEMVYDEWDDQTKMVRIKYYNSTSPGPVTVVEYPMCTSWPCPPGQIEDLEGITSARDAIGKLQVAYGIEWESATETFYMYKDASGWSTPTQVTAVDDSPGSLTIDPSGNWELVYDAWDDVNEKVRIKYYNSTSPGPVTVVEYQECWLGPSCPPGSIEDLEGITSARGATGKLHVAYGIESPVDYTDETYYMYVDDTSVGVDFTADVTSGPVPLSVNFTDQSTGDITSWSWDFGDGTTSTEQNPTHTYTDSGTYAVSLTVTGPGCSGTETKTDFIVTRDASFSSAAAFAVLANMYSDSAMANAVNALDDPAYYPLAALYASLAYDYAEDAYEDATAALAAAGQDYTFWGYYAPVYAESDINVRADAVTNINLAAQYAAQGNLELAEYYLGYGNSLAATADFYNGPTIWCASMEASSQAAAQQSSASSEVEPSANGTSTFSSAATNAVLANMNFATSVTYGVSALDDFSDIPLVQLYAQTAYDYAEAAYNDASAALAAAGQDATFWGTYAVVYAESDMTYKADALSAFDQAVQAYQAGDLATAEYYLGYGFLPACSADLYNATTIWCASMESAGATK